MNKLTALVTAIGSFSAEIVIDTFKRHSIRVVGTDIYPKEWIVNAVNVDKFYRVPLSVETKNYLDSLISICEKENVNYIIPLTDLEIDVLNEHRSIFLARGITLCFSSYETIITCRNKKKCSEFLNDLEGIDTIPSCSVHSISKQKNKYPIICKKIDGRSSEGFHIFDNQNELLAFIASNVKNDNIDSYIFQPFIDGQIITADVIRQEKTSRSIVMPRIELLRTANGAGTSVKIFSDKQLEKTCIEIAKKLNINGCINLEFIRTKSGKYFFLECNPRFSGGVKFSCMSGYDFVMNHLRCFLNTEIDPKPIIKQQYIARRYQEYIL